MDKSDEEICGQCDFEESMCGYYDESEGRFSWTRIQEPSRNPNPGLGPLTDHTFIEDSLIKGHFASTYISSLDFGVRADLWGPIIGRTSKFCKLNLWVYLKPPTYSRLSMG